MITRQRIKDLGGVAAALTAVWLLWDKIEVPDSMAPASKEYVNKKVEPLDQLSLDSAKKGITWGLDASAEGSDWPPTYVHEELCGNQARKTEGYYRTYERIVGSKHPTEGNKCE